MTSSAQATTTSSTTKSAGGDESPLLGNQSQRVASLLGGPLQRSQASKLNTLQSKNNSIARSLPQALQVGIESLTNMDMSAVRVHHDSPEPAQLNAHAYAQGNNIHLGPGQERHLPHEAWHVVQQRQGRVKPTMQTAGVAVNDERVLEREADEMGSHAVSVGSNKASPPAAQRLKSLGNLPPSSIPRDSQKAYGATLRPRARRVANTPTQLTRYTGIVGKDHKRYWKPAKGRRISAEGDSNWADGTTWDDVENSYTTREARAAKIKSQKQTSAKRRLEEMEESAKINKNRRIPARQQHKYDQEKGLAKKLLEKRRTQKKPRLHRGITFDDISSAQTATRSTMQQQFVDQEENTISPERRQELIELAQEVGKRPVPYDFLSTDVPVRAVGRLGLAIDTVGLKKPPEPMGQTRDATDDRGHLLTESMIPLSHRDAVANMPKNIIAEDSKVNQGYKRGVELWIEQQLALGNSVMQVSEPQFEGGRTDRPSSTLHHYVITDSTGQQKVVSVELGNPVRQ